VIENNRACRSAETGAPGDWLGQLLARKTGPLGRRESSTTTPPRLGAATKFRREPMKDGHCLFRDLVGIATDDSPAPWHARPRAV